MFLAHAVHFDHENGSVVRDLKSCHACDLAWSLAHALRVNGEVREYEHLGQDLASLKSALAGEFGKKLTSASRPTIIVGSAVAEHPDGKAMFELIGQFVLRGLTPV